MPEDGLPDRNS